MNKRYYNLSLYRIIVAISLVVFHYFYYTAVERINSLEFLSLQVAGLSALSGFLFSNKQIDSPEEFYKKSFKKILIPIVIVLGIILIIDTIMLIFKIPDSFLSIFASNDNRRGSITIQVGNLWYIPYILACYLITPLLNNFKKFKSIFIIFLLIIIEFIIYLYFHVRVQILPYIIGYIIGRIDFNSNVEFGKKKFIYIIIWGIVLFFFSGFRLFSNCSMYQFLSSILFFIPDMMIGVSSLFFISNLLSGILNEKNIKFFNYTDKLSYYIYLFNLFLFCGITNIIYIDLPSYIMCPLCVIIVVLLSILAERLNFIIFNKKIK